MEKNNIDIRALTTEAEQGHGSAIQKALQDLSWEDGLKVAKQIAAQNKADASDNPILPTVSLSTGTSSDYGALLRANYAKFNLSWTPKNAGYGWALYSESLRIDQLNDSGAVSIKSYDLDKNNE